MACNGRNHPADCTCAFRGGRTITSTFRTRAQVTRRAIASHTTPCPHCRRSVYFVRARNGGSFWLESPGPGWPKHECDRLRRLGKLRLVKAAWRDEGWLPMSIDAVEELGPLKRIRGARLDGDAVLVFDIATGVEIGPDLPVFYRVIDELLGSIEVDYLDSASGELAGNRAVGRLVVAAAA